MVRNTDIFSGFGGLITLNHVDLGSDIAIKSTRSCHVETCVLLSRRDINTVKITMEVKQGDKV